MRSFTRESLERHQVAICFGAVAAGAVAGLLAPGLSRGMGSLVTPAIAALMYAMFLQIPLSGLRAAWGNHRFIGALLVANFVCVPLLVWALGAHLADHGVVRIGVLLVLLTPCIDYVVVFTHMGKGDSRLMLSATPVLLLLQFALLPFYLWLMPGGERAPEIPFAPFLEAFVLFIAVPLVLAVLTGALPARHRSVRRWREGWSWLPVPAMGAVLLLVIGSQVAAIVEGVSDLLPVLAVYVAFAVLAPGVGALVARLFRLPAAAARTVAFSSATRNSLVVLPLALALPEDVRGLVATVVVAQTMVELLAELVYVKVIPGLVRGR